MKPKFKLHLTILLFSQIQFAAEQNKKQFAIFLHDCQNENQVISSDDTSIKVLSVGKAFIANQKYYVLNCLMNNEKACVFCLLNDNKPDCYMLFDNNKNQSFNLNDEMSKIYHQIILNFLNKYEK